MFTKPTSWLDIS